MQVSTYVLGVAAALGATAMGFAGCGGTVATENAGGTTGGGMGGTTTMVTGSASVSSTTVTTVSATSSTTTTSSSTSTTSSSSSSSSSGGDAACDAACAHIAQCGLGITCAQLPANFNCSTVGTQYDCLFDCAAATPCASFGAGTLQACQAQCASDGGTGTGDGGINPGDGGVGLGDGGTGADACKTCVPTNCTGPIAPCAQDATCQPWLMCTLACIQANPPVESCFQACDANNASASALYTPVWDCACTSCSNECAAINPCDHGMDGGP